MTLFRVGRVGGLAVEAHLQAIAAPGAQTDIREGLAVKAGAGLGDQGEVHVGEIAVLDQSIGAQAVGPFLIGDQRQFDRAGKGLVGGGEVRRCRHQRGTAGLHIQRAHAVKPVAVQLAVGIAGPAAAPLHGVQVAVQADDRAGEGAGEEGKNVFAVKICHFGVVVLVQLRGKAVTAEPVHGKVHDVILVKILTFDGHKLL